MIKSLAFMALLLLSWSCREELKPMIERVELGLDDAESLRALGFHPSGRGLVGGGIRFDRDRLLYTQDGGENWLTSSLDFDYGKSLLDLAWVSDEVAFAVGMDGKVLKSRDGGGSFQQSAQTDWLPLTGVAHASDSIILVAGGVGYSEGLIWRSEDQGNSWVRIDTPKIELKDIVFVEGGIGLVCGYGAILRSLDAGETWEYTAAKGDFFSAMHFPSPQRGYAVGRGGSILRTEDQGASWEKLRNGNLHLFGRHAYNDVLFETEDLGYIVGDKGLFLRTSDGGKNWSSISWPNEEDLFALSMNGRGGLLVAGGRGGLWRVRF